MRTIVWDVDDVLNNLTEVWLDDWKSSHPAQLLSYSEVAQNPPHELLSISFEDYLDSLDLIRMSVQSHERLTPNREILEWLRERGHMYRHVALTARPVNTTGPAACWVLNHFGAWIRTFAFVPVRKPLEWPEYDVTKADYLQWLNQNAVLIDDSLTNVTQAKEQGRAAILYPQPWNASRETPGEVLRQIAND